MKTVSYTILLFLLCNHFLIAQESNCVREAVFGDTNICLPEIEGYQECYTYPIVKQMADAKEVDINMVLGFYLDDQTYDKKNHLEDIDFDNYFKIYATKQVKNFKADTSILKQMQEMISSNFITENWDEMKKEIGTVNYEGEIKAPTIVKSYNVNDQSFTLIMLLKQQMENGEVNISPFTINGLLLQDRLIWMAYYLDYNGEESIVELQENNDRILAQFFN